MLVNQILRTIIKKIINMKQFFVDILTKMTPQSIYNDAIYYQIKKDNKVLHIDISWGYVDPNNVPNLEFKLPFTTKFIDYRYLSDAKYNKKIYTITINDCKYFIDFNPIEICEIDKIIYNVFSTFQSNNIEIIKKYMVESESDTIQKTPEQKFNEAQEIIAE